MVMTVMIVLYHTDPMCSQPHHKPQHHVSEDSKIATTKSTSTSLVETSAKSQSVSLATPKMGIQTEAIELQGVSTAGPKPGFQTTALQLLGVFTANPTSDLKAVKLQTVSQNIPKSDHQTKAVGSSTREKLNSRDLVPLRDVAYKQQETT